MDAYAPRDIEAILQSPDLDPVAGAMYFHVEREFVSEHLQRGRCPWCRMTLSEFEVRNGTWLHVLPCGCRVGYAGPSIDPAVVAEWDEAYS